MRLLIYGSKDFADTVKELARECGHEVIGMVDDFRTGPAILGTLEYVQKVYEPSCHALVMAIGYSNLPARRRVWEHVRTSGYALPPLIHPRAYVAESAQVGAGSMIMAGAIVDVRANIGEATVLWPGSCINHDVIIGSNTFISPNATICGFARVGQNVFVGAGAAIVDHGTVPDGSFVKMAAAFSRPYS